VPDVRTGGGAVLHEARADIGGFKKFLLRGNVVDLAVGVVIGAAFGSVVQAIVKDILNPIISAFGGVGEVSALSVTLGRITFPIGDLLNALITFLLIALVVYLAVVLPVIPNAARRCPQCSALLLPPSDEVASAMRQVAAPSGADIATTPRRCWPSPFRATASLSVRWRRFR
jgi:large conductance mechanosensitive channel